MPSDAGIVRTDIAARSKAAAGHSNRYHPYQEQLLQFFSPELAIPRQHSGDALQMMVHRAILCVMVLKRPPSKSFYPRPSGCRTGLLDRIFGMSPVRHYPISANR
jgi:hypothetical protein